MAHSDSGIRGSQLNKNSKKYSLIIIGSSWTGDDQTVFLSWFIHTWNDIVNHIIGFIKQFNRHYDQLWSYMVAMVYQH